MCFSRRMASVPKKLMAKVTQRTAMTMSSTQGSSAYSLPWVAPVTRATAAPTMSSCQPQKWMRDNASLKRRVFSRRCME